MKTLKAYLVLAAAAGALAAGASPANAATYVNDFGGIGVYNAAGSTPFYTGPYSQGGITIQYVGNGQILTTSMSGVSGYTWYPNGGADGYDAITLTGGGTFTGGDLLAGSGYTSNYGQQLTYQLLNGATVISTGSLGSLLAYPGFQDYVLPTGSYTELDVQGPPSSTTFNATQFEALAIAQITLTSASAPGPVPGAGLAGLVALALAGFYARTRRA